MNDQTCSVCGEQFDTHLDMALHARREHGCFGLGDH